MVGAIARDIEHQAESWIPEDFERDEWMKSSEFIVVTCRLEKEKVAIRKSEIIRVFADKKGVLVVTKDEAKIFAIEAFDRVLGQMG